MNNETYSRRVSENPNDILLSVRFDADALGGWNYEVVCDEQGVISRHKNFDDARLALDAAIDDES